MKNILRKLRLIVVIIFISLINVKAQWVGVSGPFAEVDAIITKGDTVICADGWGVYRSFDGGASWITIDNGLLNENIRSLAFMGDSIWAGSSSSGHLYLSVNWGLTWSLISYLHAISFITTKDSNIYVGTGSGIYVSTNKGASWNQTDSTNPNIRILTIFPYKNDVFAGTAGGGIFKSTNNGLSWQDASSGLENTDKYVYSFCTIDSSILAGTSSGIFKSTDEGLSWNLMQLDSPYTNYILQYLIRKNNNLFAASRSVYLTPSVLISTDDGVNWSEADSGLRTNSPNFQIFSFANSDNYLFVGGALGIYRTRLNTIRWELTSVGSYIAAFKGQRIINSDSSIYAATIYQGVFRSKDKGKTWKNIGLGNRTISDFLFKGNNIFVSAIYHNIGYTTEGGVLLSTDSGITWNEVDNNLTDGRFKYDVTKLAADGNDILAATEWGLYRTSNNGTDWTPAGFNDYNIMHYMQQIFVADSFLIATTRDSIFRSINDGKDWAKITDGLPAFLSINSLISVPNSASKSSLKLFLGTGDGVYNSTDGGLSWAFSGIDSNYIYCLTESGGNIFAGVDYMRGSALVSTDQGTSWSKIGDNIPSVVSGLLVMGDYIYAAVGTEGAIWRRPLSEVVTSIFTQPKTIIEHFYLQQNYPNPFNPSTTINYTVAKESFVTIKVYDLLGREIKTLVNEDKAAGKYNLRFDGSNLASGIYFYTIKAGTFFQSKKMVLLK